MNTLSVKPKNLLRIRLSVLFFMLLIMPGFLTAQKLRLKQVEIPDTVVLGSNINVRFSVENDAQTSQLGGLRLWFSNKTLGNNPAPLGFISSNQYFAPRQTRSFEITLPVQPGMFVGGGNTVVIWPSFINNTNIGADSSQIEIYVLEEPSSISGANAIEQEMLRIPNPAGEMIRLNERATIKTPLRMTLRDIRGSIIKQEDALEMDLKGVPEGIYFMEIRTSEGKIYTRKIIRQE